MKLSAYLNVWYSMYGDHYMTLYDDEREIGRRWQGKATSKDPAPFYLGRFMWLGDQRQGLYGCKVIWPI